MDSSEVMREKEEQLKRQEKWLETYKAKIEVFVILFRLSSLYYKDYSREMCFYFVF